MKFVRKRVGDQALFVILDLDPAYHQTALSLGYDEIAGGFASSCPAASPHVDRAFQNFQQYAELLLLQAARLEPVPWEASLSAWLDLVGGTQINWWLKGSAALAARGLTVLPKDIDLVVADANTQHVDDLLAEWLIQPTIPTPGWVHNSFGRSFLHCCLEWCGGVNQNADALFESDQGPSAANRLETVEWCGHNLRVPPLDLQLETVRQRGMTERGAEIQALLDAPKPRPKLGKPLPDDS